jgi:hypothetical protein
MVASKTKILTPTGMRIHYFKEKRFSTNNMFETVSYDESLTSAGNFKLAQIIPKQTPTVFSRESQLFYC